MGGRVSFNSGFVLGFGGAAIVVDVGFAFGGSVMVFTELPALLRPHLGLSIRCTVGSDGFLTGIRGALDFGSGSAVFAKYPPHVS